MDDTSRKSLLRSSKSLTLVSPSFQLNNQGPSQLIDAEPENAMAKRLQRKAVLPMDIVGLPGPALTKVIEDNHLKVEKCQAKKLQVESVVALVRGSDTFVLAGTGYGKTRIAEMYLALFPKDLKAMYLVINLLDALGDNQVNI